MVKRGTIKLSEGVVNYLLHLPSGRQGPCIIKASFTSIRMEKILATKSMPEPQYLFVRSWSTCGAVLRHSANDQLDGWAP